MLRLEAARDLVQHRLDLGGRYHVKLKPLVTGRPAGEGVGADGRRDEQARPGDDTGDRPDLAVLAAMLRTTPIPSDGELLTMVPTTHADQPKSGETSHLREMSWVGVA
ncbi:hypothetical protein GCM10010106_50410 [Thermopolyspora flexuosa]|nr:MAG: hypothetical protein DIU75_22255 [Mycolicibacterium hassiacum]GGM95507.1 hypothetical protein GCM10010106_50410 [Thermopolyspora flexuosa]